MTGLLSCESDEGGDGLPGYVVLRAAGSGGRGWRQGSGYEGGRVGQGVDLLEAEGGLKDSVEGYTMPRGSFWG